MAHWFGTDSTAFTYEYQTVGKDTYDANLTGPGYQEESDLDDFKPPQMIILTGQLQTDYQYLINSGDALGDITARQVVAVANVIEDEGSFTMSRDTDDWYRAQTLGDVWSGRTRQKVVVDYRILEPGKVQIQWAPFGSWLTDEGSAEQTQQVAQRWTYSMNYATAEVRRKFTDDTGIGHHQPGSRHSAAMILREGPAFPSNNHTDERFLEQRQNWINAQISDEYAHVAESVIAIVRPIMYEWAVKDAYLATHDENSTSAYGSLFIRGWGILDGHGHIENEFIRLLPNNEFPFGDEDHSETQRSEKYPELDYPYLIGHRYKGITGCYPTAAEAFLAIGIVALLIAILRVWAGPAELTSWTGQHVYLSQTGVISALQDQEALASGYLVAPPQLGKLQLRFEEKNLSNISVDGEVIGESKLIHRESSL